MAVVDLDLPEGKAGPEDVIDTITARSPESPILVLSESAEIEDRVRLAHSGNCAFLQKPAQPSEILDAVGDLFAREPDGQEIVLAVDDDPLILEALGQYLDGRFRLVPVQDPLEFWEVLDEVAPTVVMLDVDMPGVSGIELCRVIRSDQRWRGLPILFLTAHRDAKTIQEMFEAGADDYVNKPIIGAELLTRLANRVERAQLYRRLAETDGLTGASMRRQSVRVLGRYIRLARRQNRPLSVAILDVDHFKSVNDRFGHNVGDRVLSRVGGLLVDTFRVEDLVARWGGEEFLVGMYGTAREDAATRVRAILKEVRGIVFQDDTGGEFSITISGGVAELWDESATLDDLIRSADDALYMAKDTGRDRVIVAGDEHAGSGEAR